MQDILRGAERSFLIIIKLTDKSSYLISDLVRLFDMDIVTAVKFDILLFIVGKVMIYLRISFWMIRELNIALLF